MALTSEEMPELYFLNGGEDSAVQVKWSTRQPSRPYAIQVDGGLVLYSWVDNGEGERKLTPIHRVSIPAGATEVLLLAWYSKDKLRLQVIEDDFLNGKFNHWLLINVSSKDIAWRVGKDSKPTLIKSAASKIYKLAVEKNEGASIIGQANIEGEVKMFYSSYFPVKDGRRTIVIFSDHEEKIRTKLIADHFLRKETEGR